MNNRKVRFNFYCAKSVPFKFSTKQLHMGLKVEREHTTDPRLARAIALAHLEEDKRYYTKLKKAGL